MTYVAVDGASILGFVTVAAASIETSAVPAAQRRKLPSYRLPVLRLARLAADQGAQGRGVGRALLRVAFSLAHGMAKSPLFRDQPGSGALAVVGFVPAGGAAVATRGADTTATRIARRNRLPVKGFLGDLVFPLL